jgi:tRNA-2-methylthio-N6-dimethylallyladenosine synthase
MLIAVAGCVARPKAPRSSRAPAVDMVVGPQSYHRLPEMIARIARGGGHALETDFPALDKFDSLAGSKRRRQRLSHRAGRLRQVLHLLRRALTRAAPNIRGPSQAQIDRRSAALVAKGAREITLLGQNVNAYRGAGPDGETWTWRGCCGGWRIEGLRACATPPAIRATWATI